MRLLHITDSMAPEAGGTVEAVLRLVETTGELGAGGEIVCLDPPGRGAGDNPNPVIHRLGPGCLGTYNYVPKLKPWLDREIKRFDAVIVHGMWQFHGLAAAKASRQAGIPYFVYPHGMLDPWFNQTYPLKRLKKQLYWPFFEHPVLKNAASLLFTCDEERLLAQKSFRPYKVKETVVGLGTSAPRQSREELKRSFRRKPPAWGNSPFLLFIGRIQEKKGLDMLLEAYHGLHAAGLKLPSLVIAGPIQQPDYASKLKRAFSLPGVHWVGSLRGEEKWQALASAEAMVLPSHQENFGIVVAEALSVGTPPIITNKVNIWREVKEAGAGLVGDDTTESITALLKTWLELDECERIARSNAALECFKNTFDIRVASQKLLDCAEQSISE